MKSVYKELPKEQRYKIIQSMVIGQRLSIETCRLLTGFSVNTIKRAISYYGKMDQLPTQGRKKMLQKHHIDYIESQTISNPKLSAMELAHMLVSSFPDIKHCSKQTIVRVRHAIGLEYLPMRVNCAITQNSRNIRINWCNQQQENETD